MYKKYLENKKIELEKELSWLYEVERELLRDEWDKKENDRKIMHAKMELDEVDRELRDWRM